MVFCRIISSKNKIDGPWALANYKIPNFAIMKTILLLLTVVFTTMAVTGCTNDEGEDLDVITPNDEEELLQKEHIKVEHTNNPG